MSSRACLISRAGVSGDPAAQSGQSCRRPAPAGTFPALVTDVTAASVAAVTVAAWGQDARRGRTGYWPF